MKQKQSNEWMVIAILFMAVTLFLAILYLYTSRTNSSNICVPKVGGIYTPLTEKGFMVAVIPTTDAGKTLANNLNRQFNPEFYQGVTK